MEYTETPMPAVPLAEFTTPVYRIEITVEYSFVILADHQFAFRMVNILIVQGAFLVNVDFAGWFPQLFT